MGMKKLIGGGDNIRSHRKILGRRKWTMNINEVLLKSEALIDGDHFVYKAGTHGAAYINKEKFPFVGALNLTRLIGEVATKAVNQGLNLGGAKSVGIIGPAMGAIPYSLTLAEAFEKLISGVIFFPARTELKEGETGNKIHVIPDKQKDLYRNSIFVISEDITNNGTTIREVRKLFESELGVRVVAAVCFVDRGGQTANSLGIDQYFPLLRVDMEQRDVRKHQCPLCKEGKPINTVLGKGKRWVELF